MGCWNQTCAITGNAIYVGDEVVAMWLLDGNPLPFHIRGEYNDYGAVENERGPMLEEAMAFFKEYLYEMEEGENKYHDIPVKKDALDFKLLMEADQEERLFLNYNPYKWIDVPEKQVLGHIEIHASVFDELAKHDIQSYGIITHNVEYYVSVFQKYLEALNEKIEGDDETVAIIRSLNRMRESEQFSYLMNDGSGKRFSPNVFHFRLLRSRFLEAWENDPSAIEKFTNMAETFMVCSFLQHAGHAMCYPANVGQEDNSAEVIKLANITLKTAQQLSTRWDEDYDIMVERKIIEYITVKNSDEGKLNKRVNELLIEGWELYGYPYATGNRTCQALVRYERDISVLNKVPDLTKNKSL